MSSQIYSDIQQIIHDNMDAANLTDCIEGTVDSVEPLQILIDQNTEYDPESVYLIPEELTDYQSEVEFEGEFTLDNVLIDVNVSVSSDFSVTKTPVMGPVTTTGKFTGTLKVKNGLVVGDKVLLLKCKKGQRKYILGRI